MSPRRTFILTAGAAAAALLTKHLHAQPQATAQSATAQPPASQLPEGARPITAKIWQDCARLAGISTLPANSSLQAIFFFDANCPYCAKLYQWAEQHASSLTATLWLPVAYMHNTSLPRAVGLLRSPNPQAALKQNFDQFNHSARQGAVQPAEQISPRERTTIQTNTQAWQTLMGATPLWFYKTKQGQYWQQAGMPDAPRLQQILQQLAPAQLQEFKP